MLYNVLAGLAQEVEMADRLRADGKIWVVVLVIAVVFAGLIVYLVRLDRQVSRLEKDLQDRRTRPADSLRQPTE